MAAVTRRLQRLGAEEALGELRRLRQGQLEVNEIHRNTVPRSRFESFWVAFES